MSWWPRKNIVVPVDFSDESFTGLDQALEMVDDPSHLQVVHVLANLSANEPGIVWGVVDKASRIQHVKKTFAERLTDEKYTGVNIKVVLGDPGHEIAEFAQQIGADLIVMPSHGRTGLKRLLVGSVAERVVRLAHCPVLVLRK